MHQGIRAKMAKGQHNGPAVSPRLLQMGEAFKLAVRHPFGSGKPVGEIFDGTVQITIRALQYSCFDRSWRPQKVRHGGSGRCFFECIIQGGPRQKNRPQKRVKSPGCQMPLQPTKNGEETEARRILDQNFQPVENVSHYCWAEV
jgi:hypothetical protein